MTDACTSANRAAAFFDVDGTLVRTTIVHYYMYFRRKRMSRIAGILWHAAFLLKCAYYLLLDKVDRSRLNVIFYRSYAGLWAREIKSDVQDCYREVIEPRCFGQAVACIDAHRAAGLQVVLVTGSIDFIVEPLARRLRVTDVVAPSLVESDGRFTGELNGPPIGDEEKARRIRGFAKARDIDLSLSHAYGDSIADLPMLEQVGHPRVVNPDRALAAVPERKGWPTRQWRAGGVGVNGS